MGLSVQEELAFTEHVLFTHDAEASGFPKDGESTLKMPVLFFVLIITQALLCHPTFND